jgi:uroporphyrinogen decarboxylase
MVASTSHARQVRPQCQHLGLTPQAGRAEDGAFGQIGDAPAVRRQESVTRVLARQHRGNLEAVGQPGRHVLHGVDGEIDPHLREGRLDLFGEEALAADLGERPVAHAVAGGPDDDDLAGPRRRQVRIGGGQAVAGLPRLGQGQRAASGADAQERLGHGLCCHGILFRPRQRPRKGPRVRRRSLVRAAAQR